MQINNKDKILPAWNSNIKYNNRHLWASATSGGDLHATSPTISYFLTYLHKPCSSQQHSTESLTSTGNKPRWKIHHTSVNGSHLSALNIPKVWNDFNQHLFIYSHPWVWFVEFMLLCSDDSHGKRRQVFLNEVASSHKGNYGQFYISRLE